jgi:1-acyl-sn-glycerol-3-phosphate acyltransferase
MVPLIAIATVVMGTISLFSSFFDSTGALQHKIAVAWARMLLRITMVRIDVIGAQRLDPNRHYVLVSNHFSLIDTPVMFGSMPRPFRILARHGLWRIPFLGWHLNRAGHIPVRRERPRDAVAVYPVAAQKIRDGYSLLIFPEGGRTRHDDMSRFKPGAAYIAIAAQCPIVPMAIVGTREILPPGSSNLRPGRGELRIGEPISTEGLERGDAKELMKRVREEVARIWAAEHWD